jgi:hypothetical protein
MVAIPMQLPPGASATVTSTGTVIVIVGSCDDATTSTSSTETIWLNVPRARTTWVDGNNFNEPEWSLEWPSEWLPMLADVCEFGIIYWYLTEFAAKWPRLKPWATVHALITLKARLKFPVGET